MTVTTPSHGSTNTILVSAALAALCLPLLVLGVGIGLGAFGTGVGFLLGDGYAGVMGWSTPFLAGLGLALESDTREAIERLTDEIEGVASGRTDVEFSTDREDAIGDLYRAVDSMRATLGERGTDSHPRPGGDREDGFLDISPDAVALVGLDDERSIREVNAEFAATFGCDRTDVEGDSLFDVVDGVEDDDRVERWSPGDDGGPIRRQVRRRTVDGTGTFLYRFVPLSPPGGDDARPTRGYAVYTEFTDRTERGRRERNRRLKERAMEAAPIGVTIADATAEDDPLIDVNERFEQMTGYTAEAVLGRNCRFLQGEGTDEETVAKMRDAIDAEEPVSVTLRNYREDGTEFWNRVSIAPIEDEEGDVTHFVGFQQDVSERTATNRQLRESERTLREAYERFTDGVLAIDTEWRYTYVNAEAGKLVGRDPDELVGTEIWEAFPELEGTEFGEAIRTAMETNRTTSVEEFYPPHDAWYDATVYPDDDGVTVYVRDVTEREERERELDRTKDLLEYAQNVAQIGGWEVDVSTDPWEITWTEELYRLYGLPQGTDIDFETAIGRFHPDDRDRVREGVETAIEAGESYDMEVRLQTGTGDQRWVRAMGEPVREDGEVVKLRGSLQDLTDRKETERKLQRYREYTDDVLDAIDDLFYVLDSDGKLQRWNDSFPEMTGYSEAELASRDALEFFPEEERETVAAAIEDTFETGSSRVEASFLTSDGDQVPYEFSASRVENPDGDVMLAGIGRDISERKRRERRLERNQHLLEQTQRLARIGGWEMDLESGPPYEGTLTDEVARIHEVPPDEPFDMEKGIEFYHPEDQPRVREAVERAIEAGEPYRLEARLITAEGNERWVETNCDPVREDGEVVKLRGSLQDITETKERQRELERTKDLLDQTQSLANVGGWEIEVGDDPPDYGIQTDGLYRIFGLTPDDDLHIWKALEFAHPDDRGRFEDAVEGLLEEQEPFEVEGRITTATDEDRWIEAVGVPVYEDGELRKYRGAVVDVTDRKEYELALASLHEMARDLLTAETEATIADLMVDTAADILETPAVAVYRLDTDASELVPAAVSSGFVDYCGGTPAVDVGDGDSPLWNTFATGEQTVFEKPTGTERSPLFDEGTGGGLLVPLGDHRVFVAISDSTAPDERRRQLVDTLAATTEAAYDRLASEADLRERDAQLEAQNERLERQIQINEIIRSIDQSLIDATDRAEVQRMVCERLVDGKGIAFAWIGEVDASGSRLDPVVWSGADEGYLDVVQPGESSAEPSWTTAESDDITVVSNVVEELQSESWPSEALARDFHSVVSVPLSFDGYTYGVLSVYAEEPNTFGALERSVFGELGETIGNSINAIETRQALYSETVLELELTVDSDETFLGRVARETGSRVEFEGLSTDSEGDARLFFRATGTDADTVKSALSEFVSVGESHLVSDSGDSLLFEVTVTAPVLVAKLVRHGGRFQAVQADEEKTDLVVNLPRSTDVREFLEMLEPRYPSVELSARRDVERGDEAEAGQSSLFENLTERQLEVLRTAYFAGFFESPRETSTEGVADILGVSQPTVSRHLRRGQKRLFDQLFDADNSTAT